MKQQANWIRVAGVIEHDGNRWTVLKQQIIGLAKAAPSSSRWRCATCAPATRPNERWRTADTVERSTTEEKEHTHSYTDGINLVPMDPQTHEEAHVPADLMGDVPRRSCRIR